MRKTVKLTDDKLKQIVSEEIKNMIGEAELKAFRKGLRKIDEISINRILQHGKDGYVIISANRSEIYSENPKNDLSEDYMKWCAAYGREISDKGAMDYWLIMRNNTEDEKLVDILKKSKYAYSPVYGGYKGTDGITDDFEPSYIVYNHSRQDNDNQLDFKYLYEFALKLAKKFKQDSVYVCKPGEAPIYVDGDGNKVNSRESKSYKINQYSEKYFTTKNRKRRTTSDYPDKEGNARLETPPQRFTADIQFESFYRKAGPSNYGDRIKRSQAGEVFLD